MNFKICKFMFTTELHIGNGLLTDAEFTMYADTFFSALCHEAFKINGSKGIEDLYNAVEQDRLVFSDGLPYVDNVLYLPKPLNDTTLPLGGLLQDIKTSSERKDWKKLKFLPASCFVERTFLNIQDELERVRSIGKSYLRIHAGIHGLEETEPYGVGGFRFRNGCGMYIIIGMEEEQKEFIMELLDSLALTGIGGKTSIGMGRFEFSLDELDHYIQERLCYGEIAASEENLMTLSVSLPKDNLDEILKDSYYAILKRSGFITSSTYTSSMKEIDGFTKRRNLYVLKSGSCMKKGYEGKIIDLNEQPKNHPVYRYAKPLFWRLEG